MVEAVGRHFGGRWGGALARLGIVMISGGTSGFFSRLLAWRAGQER